MACIRTNIKNLEMVGTKLKSRHNYQIISGYEDILEPVMSTEDANF